MDTASYLSLSLEELAIIVKNRYRPGHYAVVEPNLDHFRRLSHSLDELFERLDGYLNQSMMSPSQIDPANQALIDKRFRTLVNNELSKRFGDKIHLVNNLDEIINTSRTLKEIQVRVQVEITNKKDKDK